MSWMDWMFWIGLMAVGVICAIIVSARLHHRRTDRRAFNEFFAAVLIYELGDKFDSSLAFHELIRLMPCPPEEARYIVMELEQSGILETEYRDGVKRVLLGIVTWTVFDGGNWRRAAQTPEARQRFDRALDVARSKFAAAA